MIENGNASTNFGLFMYFLILMRIQICQINLKRILFYIANTGHTRSALAILLFIRKVRGIIIDNDK